MEDSNQSAKKRWNFDDTISIPNIISVVTAILYITWWTATFSAESQAKFNADDKRIQALEARQSNTERIAERLIIQETKMDSLIEATRDMQNEFKEFRKAEVSIRRAEIKYLNK